MNRLVDDGTVVPEPRTMVLAGLCLIALAVALAALALWSLISVHEEYRRLLTQEAPVLLHSPGVSFFYLGFISLLGLLLFGCCAFVAGVRRKPDDPGVRGCRRLAGYLVFFGLIAMFAGRYVGNWYWSETFREAGYVSCTHSFSITQKWDTKVWVQDKAFCTDEEVLRLFASYKNDLSDVNNYLRGEKQN